MPDSSASLISSVDTIVGDRVEAAVRAKHWWRLRRLGWSHALAPPDDGPWVSGDPPPRAGCSLEVLIDGAEAFPAIADAIAGARDYVHITGWHIAPYFELVRGERPGVLGELLAEAAERVDVNVLVWAGAPVPAFHPTRKEVREGVETLTRGTRIRCETDPREHPFHCHHEKTVIVDGEIAFVGGIDMTDYAGDRFDTSDHPARRRLGWHDVGTRLRGPAVADVDDHFALRWRELTGDELERPAPPAPAGEHTVQVVRTIANGMYDAVRNGEYRILESYVRAIRSAQRFIYLENQFLWAPEIADLLADKLRRPPCDEFRLVIVLPARANNGQDDTMGQLGQLVEADDDAGRLLAATIRSLSGHRDDRLYVHAKVGIVDDRWLTVGSANLNAHSLLNDTEMNVVTDDPGLARATRLRLWAEHLEVDVATIGDEAPHKVVDKRWRPTAFEQLDRLRSGAPPNHRLLALPGLSRRSRRLLGPLVGLVDDG
ncbi:MAG TPA: phosphatidylserine/phosphatidylglycerophosphate/cardiolipin synthase family protein [Solirubrobacteraceae bacterium]|nr:phosphatidylserine/phosphatidylglycerophosphate/cardiolipin synthase family protein [Solirubrobacteraceae bacterium]